MIVLEVCIALFVCALIALAFVTFFKWAFWPEDTTSPISANDARKMLEKHSKEFVKSAKGRAYSMIREYAKAGNAYAVFNKPPIPEVITDLKKHGFNVHQEEGVTTVTW